MKIFLGDVVEDAYKLKIMDGQIVMIIVCAIIFGYFVQFGMGIILAQDESKSWKIWFIIPGIGFLAQFIYLWYCLFQIYFDEE